MSAPTPSGWADDRLMQAKDLIIGVRNDHEDAKIRTILSDLENAIERADEEIEAQS